jgi:hypothetical protein
MECNGIKKILCLIDGEVPLISNVCRKRTRGKNYECMNFGKETNDIWRTDGMDLNLLKLDVRLIFQNVVLTDHIPSPLQSRCVEK